MIVGRLTNGTFIVGIDATNVQKLKDGKPMVIKLSEMGIESDVVVMYGETLEDVVKELERANGKPLPPPDLLPTSQGEH